MTRPAGYIPTLDGWRAIAVTAVIAEHLSFGGVFGDAPAVRQVLSFGHYGVDLFFSISGFLITTRLMQELAETGKVSLTHFYIRRAFRILPPVLLLLAFVGVALRLTHLHVDRLPWIGALLFFANFVETPRIIMHFWSLAVEEHFYLFWPVLFLVLYRVRKLWLVAVLAVAVFGWRLAVLRGWIADPLISSQGRTDLRLDALLWGCALGLLWASERGRRILERTLSLPVWLLAVAAFCAAHWLTFEVGSTVRALSAPLMLAGTALRPAWLHARLLETAPMRWLGRLSYSLYLFQQPFMPWGGTLQHPILILPAACLSYYLVEQPMIRLGRDVLARRAVGRARLVIAGTFVALALGAWISALIEDESSAVFFTDAGFKGDANDLAPGTYDLSKDPSVPNNSVSSLRVGSRARVRICARVEMGTSTVECRSYGRGATVPFVGDFNDRTSTIEVVAE